MAVYIIYTYIHTDYIHTAQGRQTRTFSPSHRPAHLYTHNVADGPRDGHVQGTLAEAHNEGVQNPVSTSWLQKSASIKARMFSESYHLHSGSWAKAACGCTLCRPRHSQGPPWERDVTQ